MRSVREMVDEAHRLEELPKVAAAAYAGHVSPEQLGPLTKLADSESDAEWAARAPNTAPADLAQLARSKAKPTSEDYAKQHAARSVRMWWDENKKFLNIRGQFAAVDGAIIEDPTQQDDRPDAPRQGTTVGAARSTRRRRAGGVVPQLRRCRRRRARRRETVVLGQCPADRSGRGRRDPVAGLDGRELARVGKPRTRPDRRTRHTGRERDESLRRCRTRSPARSGCATDTAAGPAAIGAPVCRSITSGPVRGAAPTRSRTSRRCASAAALTTTNNSHPTASSCCSATPTGPTACDLICRDQLAEQAELAQQANAPPDSG